MNLKKLLIVGALIIGSGGVGFWMGEKKLQVAVKNWKPAVVINQIPTQSSGLSQVDFELFWEVWTKVSEMYVDKTALDPKKMVDGAISGMVAAIGDPYTIYLPVVENKESKEDLGGAFEGVGIQLGFDKDNRLSVVSPLEGSPAFRAGVKTGDLILHVKDERNNVDRDTAGITVPEAVKLIRGSRGTKVILTLYRNGQDDTFDVELERDTIVVKSLTLEYKEKDGKEYAWLKMTRFGDRTQTEWTEAVNSIVTKSAEGSFGGVVLDLRNNPGGYLDGAVYFASEFLAPNKLVVKQRFGSGLENDLKVDRNGRLLKTPLVVLVNKGSASASEIMAGALQDHKRAKIVGEQSFGKGSVQQPEDFPDGSGIHVTIAKWLRPSGEWIDKKGIKPDFEVAMDENDETADPQLDRAIQAL